MSTSDIIAYEIDDTPSRPDGLIAMAVERDLDINKLETLLELKRQWDADNARKAFFKALSKFQSDIPPIVKQDKVNAGVAGKRRFANLGTISEAIKPYLETNNLSFRFRQSQSPQAITITCIVSHADGHSEETTLSAAPDQSGGKNAIQALGSAITYLMRYTLIGSLGLTTVDEDTDGETKPPTPATTPTPAPAAAQATRGVKLSAVVEPQSLDGNEVELSGPCSADHIDYIKDLAHDLGMPAEAIKQAVQRRGKQRLAELTIVEAEQLIAKLKRRKNDEEIPF
jgi:hypothetical protein